MVKRRRLKVSLAHRQRAGHRYDLARHSICRPRQHPRLGCNGIPDVLGQFLFVQWLLWISVFVNVGVVSLWFLQFVDFRSQAPKLHARCTVESRASTGLGIVHRS